jgi:hypothetical protein
VAAGCYLDEVAAGIVEHGGGDGAHFRRLLSEPDAEVEQPSVFSMHVRHAK